MQETSTAPQRRPRLLLVTHYFPSHRGGVEIVAGELAARLSSHFEIQWLAADCDEPPDLEGICSEGQAAWNTLERFGLPWPIWKWKAWSALWRAVRDADLIHLHDYIYPANMVVLALARLHRKPVVVTQHIGDIEYRNPLLRFTLRQVNRVVGRHLLCRADQVVFISPRVRTLFERYTPFKRPPVFWPNGVDLATFHPLDNTQRQSLRARLGATPEQVIVLFAGRFVEKKGLTFIRQLAERQADWKWWFAGWGTPGPYDPNGWNLPQAHVWHDRRGAGMAELYQAADVLVLPSYGEGFPLVVQESLACGTPVVISAETVLGMPGLPNAIRAEPYTPSQSLPEDWLKALSEVVTAPDREFIRAEAAEYASNTWDWDRLAHDYAALFNDLNNPGNRPHPPTQTGSKASAQIGR